MQTITDFFQTASVGECTEILDFWLNECNLDEAPSPTIVLQWQQLFQQRGNKFNLLVAFCQQWLDEEAYT